MNPPIPSSEAARVWRAASGQVAVVAGTFDILHPGNLAALRHARSIADRVLVLLAPDAAFTGRSTHPQNAQAVRAEVVAQLRDADAVAIAEPDAGLWGEALRPFVWVTRDGTGGGHPLAAALAAAATKIVPVPGPVGCSTAAIHAAIAAARTPIAVPAALYPTPASDDTRPAGGSLERPLVTVNGCFDILHVGHVRFLGRARSMGRRLIVLTNDDASVKRYKGPTRPVFPVGFRAAALNALRCVDGVVAFSDDDPLALIRRLRPDVHVKGGSYEADRVRQERDLLESWGGRLVCTDLVQGYSTTAYVEQAKASPDRAPGHSP